MAVRRHLPVLTSLLVSGPLRALVTVRRDLLLLILRSLWLLILMALLLLILRCLLLLLVLLMTVLLLVLLPLLVLRCLLLLLLLVLGSMLLFIRRRCLWGLGVLGRGVYVDMCLLDDGRVPGWWRGYRPLFNGGLRSVDGDGQVLVNVTGAAWNRDVHLDPVLALDEATASLGRQRSTLTH